MTMTRAARLFMDAETSLAHTSGVRRADQLVDHHRFILKTLNRCGELDIDDITGRVLGVKLNPLTNRFRRAQDTVHGRLYDLVEGGLVSARHYQRKEGPFSSVVWSVAFSLTFTGWVLLMEIENGS